MKRGLRRVGTPEGPARLQSIVCLVRTLVTLTRHTLTSPQMHMGEVINMRDKNVSREWEVCGTTRPYQENPPAPSLGCLHTTF
ncbi:hypothetical protein E2C01_064056 [Portunus trituberculatus]|uniref:Uncharacterized protein n=1 Tax=Portunus trituberculatus TaxID=210409 RepID=A0A5B7HJU7_PORTR|nr:hypothetical protein [Portunus trituberculatus]